LVGGLVGATLLGGIEGLDSVLTALFVVLTMDAFRACPDWATLNLAVGAAASPCSSPRGRFSWSP
jgi:predicted branched-subunit amino acid permease